MYRMSESEFMQYEMAEMRLTNLRKQHAMEMQEAYDGIHPTRTGVDYGLGNRYSESINPADYAIYLVELDDGHKRAENWWTLRSEAYKEALTSLDDEEKNHLNLFENIDYQKREQTRKKLRGILSGIISARPDLQRQRIPLNELEDMEEADHLIDNMSEKELMEDYWNLDEQLNDNRMKEQCIRLCDTHGMNYGSIGKTLGITAARVKRYVIQGEAISKEKQPV